MTNSNVAATADVATPYSIDAEMLGPQFAGHAKHLDDFVATLARVTGRPESDFVVRQHVSQYPGAEEPTEEEWNQALDEFASENPELFPEAQ